MTSTEFKVVVGVDGSADARTAAEWAAREASAHDGVLLVVHAWSLPAVTSDSGPLSAIPFENIERSAQELLDAEATHLRDGAPDLRVETRLVYGSPIEVLMELSTDATVIVVGSRGIGRVQGLILGSVSQAIVGRAQCAVLVIPPADGKRS
jgi:nucleotide-binding universal stress UspA family protein